MNWEQRQIYTFFILSQHPKRKTSRGTCKLFMEDDKYTNIGPSAQPN